jgi:hypothetical protein
VTDAKAQLMRFIEDIETQTTRPVDIEIDLDIDLDLIAVGWATIDFDRAIADLTTELGLPLGAFGPAADDVALGARCLMAPGALRGSRSPLDLVLLEPSTEGRLAATLARCDEGPAAAWLATADLGAATLAWRRAGRLASPRDGPLGPASLLLDGPIHGPHRFLVQRAPGTIAR